MGKYKDYVFQHQKKRFRLRIYPYGIASKIFMDNSLCDVGISDSMSKIVLDFYYRDERNQQHHVLVERKSHWFRYHYAVSVDGQVIYRTRENDPS